MPWTNEVVGAYTVHPLASCRIGDDPATSALDDRHELRNHPGIFVTDGSAVPCGVTVNPALTIAAVAERALPALVAGAGGRGVLVREAVLGGGVADRAAKGVVAAGVSLGNACPYCVDVHSAVLRGLAHGGEADAIGGGRVDAMADPALRDLAAWARSSGRRESILRRDPPFPVGQRPQFAGVVVPFHYLY